MTGPAIRRGEVWWVTFDSSVGGEIRKTRPAVIVSNDRSNAHLNRCQVVPLTRTTKRLFPSEAIVNVGGVLSKAAADQVTTAGKERLRNRVGRVSATEMAAIEAAIRVQLAL